MGGEDYSPMIASVTLPATMDNGRLVLTASVPLLDDRLLEFVEDFIVFLDNDPPPFGVMIDLMSNQTTVTLNDDGMSLHVHYFMLILCSLKSGRSVLEFGAVGG